MFHQASMHDVKVIHEAMCSNVTPSKYAMFDQASMLLCECFVHASALHLQLDSEFFPPFHTIHSSKRTGELCMHQNVKTFVAYLEFTCIHTHTME